MKVWLKFVVVLVPLVVLLMVGVVAALLAECFIWLDDQCQCWFMEIWNGH